MRVDLLLMKNILTPLTKRVLIPLGFTVATPVTDAGIQGLDLEGTIPLISKQKWKIS